jgi:hypothetical protein
LQEVPNTALRGAQAVSYDLVETTEALRKLADWKDSLRSRIADATYRFEVNGLNDNEYHSLIDEVAAFKAACQGVRS